MIRHAIVRDVPRMSDIINDCAEHGLMLHRSLEYLYDHMRDFQVAVEDGSVVGVCGLRVVWANFAEVYALAVEPAQRGKGLGRKLVEACVEEARQLGIPRLMTLTYEKAFFERLNFERLDREALPLKVWSECIRCSKNQACDEIAMVRVLEGVHEPAAPQPAQPPARQVLVPVTLRGVVPQHVEQRPKMDEAPEHYYD